MSDRFKMLLEAHLILLDDEGRVLLLRRCNTDYENESYGLVAGKVDAGEEVTAAAIREAWEEVGVELLAGDVEVGGVMTWPGIRSMTCPPIWCRASDRA